MLRIGLSSFKPRSLTRERHHQPVKHQVQGVVRIPAILELAEILGKVLAADVNLRPVDATLQLRQKPLVASMPWPVRFWGGKRTFRF